MKIRFAFFFLSLFSLFQVLAGQTIGTFSSIQPASQDELFHIPATHRWQLLIKAGDNLTAGGVMPINSDFTGYVPIQGSSENGYLAVNSETLPGGVTVLDIQFNSGTKIWEVTASEKVDFSALGNSFVSGTIRNCSGGITPWGTVVTCEENDISTDLTGDGYTDWGWNIEIDPATRKVIDYDNDNQIDKIWAMGRFAHENVAVAEDSVTVYQGEDNSANGFVYKYIAHQAGDLSSGDLYVLQVSGSTGSWIQIPNLSKSDRNNTVSLSVNAGGTGFTRVEDVEIGPDGKIYFASTSQGKVFRFDDNGSTVSNFEVFVDNAAMAITHAGGTSQVTFSGPDNLAFDGEGNLWVTQDGGGLHIWVVGPSHTAANPDIRVFANTPLDCEPTGITFSPDYRFLFMSLQHPGNSNSDTTSDVTGTTVTFNRDATIVIARQGELGASVGAAEVLESDGLRFGDLYPNPVTGEVHFQLDSQKGGMARISVIEVLGRVTLSTTRYLDLGENTVELALDDLPAGQYVLLVETKEGKISKVFAKY